MTAYNATGVLVTLHHVEVWFYFKFFSGKCWPVSNAPSLWSVGQVFHLEVQVWYPTRAAWSWSGVVPSMMWETWAIDKFFPKGAACCHPWDLYKQNCLACIDTHLGAGSKFTASQLPSVTETLDVQLQHTSATWTENMLHHLTNIDFIHFHVQVGQRLAGWSKLESLITVSRKASELDQVQPHSCKPFALYNTHQKDQKSSGVLPKIKSSIKCHVILAMPSIFSWVSVELELLQSKKTPWSHSRLLFFGLFKVL